MVLVLNVPTTIIRGSGNFEVNKHRWDKVFCRKWVSMSMAVRMSSTTMQYLDKPLEVTKSPIMVNGCTSKIGKAVVEAAVSAGHHEVPVSFSSSEVSGKTMQVGGNEIQVHSPSDRESVLASIVNEYPNLVVVDYTMPATVMITIYEILRYR